MTDKTILKAEGVVAGYTDLNILKGVDFRVKQGEMVSVIGPNGAGKSTLLKTIFGILEPREGSIKLKDTEITGEEPENIVRKGISYVPQLENTFNSLTVEENLEMGGILHENPSKRIKEIYDFFPILRERRNDRVETLSGGQQKAVAFGRGLMLEPDVLLLDEPSAGLSPKLTEEVWGKIRRTNATGTAIVMVEQNAKQALRMSDYGFVLDGGRNRFSGEGRDLLKDDSVAKLYLGG